MAALSAALFLVLLLLAETVTVTGVRPDVGNQSKICDDRICDMPESPQNVDRSELLPVQRFYCSCITSLPLPNLSHLPPSSWTMVHLVLCSTKGISSPSSSSISSHPLLGNQGLRYFPYTGYLGLTPIRVEGSVSFGSSSS